MTDRRIPTRTIQTQRPAAGSAGQGVGWLRPLEDRLRGLRAQLEGLHMRLGSPLADGVPAAVAGEVTFKANQQTNIAVPLTLQEAPISIFGTVNVFPILLAGETYRVPVTFSPPGVFMAHNLAVNIEAGWPSTQGRPLVWALGDYRQSTVGGFLDSSLPADALNFSQQQQVLHYGYDPDTWGQYTYLPYFWNIVDEKSGRQYSQDWLPHGLLMNGSLSAANVLTTDSSGELFEFDTPWLFERDAQVSFLFRPIMDLYQLDTQVDIFKPQAQAKVCVEFHGNRYYTRQDVLKEGARL
jgi:hypothetical protein